MTTEGRPERELDYISREMDEQWKKSADFTRGKPVSALGHALMQTIFHFAAEWNHNPRLGLGEKRGRRTS